MNHELTNGNSPKRPKVSSVDQIDDGLFREVNIALWVGDGLLEECEDLILQDVRETPRELRERIGPYIATCLLKDEEEVLAETVNLQASHELIFEAQHAIMGRLPELPTRGGIHTDRILPVLLRTYKH